MQGLLKEIWNANRIPEDWKTAIICPMFKKGDPMDTSNYRGIALLDSCYKILSLALLRRLEVYSRDIIGNYQSGFLRTKSTSDHIFRIRQIMEKLYEFGKDFQMYFVDLRHTTT
uniref:Reverse transcriptase domain-containing protein n=1 Tax=Schizaphis graminum TaxID=13262 RepID=A0A2S2NR89_SCHGA